MFGYESMLFIINFTITTTVSLMFMKENVSWELGKIKFSKKPRWLHDQNKKFAFSFDNFIVQIKSHVSNWLLVLLKFKKLFLNN